MLSNVGSSSRLSCVLAPSMATPSGTPAPSVSTERLTPDFARSVGFGPVFFPAQWRFGHRPVDALELPLNAFQVSDRFLVCEYGCMYRPENFMLSRATS